MRSKPLLILTIGYNGSGKTTLLSRLAADTNLNIVEGDSFREYLSKNIQYYSDLDFLVIPTRKLQV